jgi:hypothetical protein
VTRNDGDVTNLFIGNEASFAWNDLTSAATAQFFLHYNIDIYHGTSAAGTFIRSESTNATFFDYIFDANELDGSGTPSRAIFIEVNATNTGGVAGTEGDYTMSNAAPTTAVATSVSASSSEIFAVFPFSSASDFAGRRVWIFDDGLPPPVGIPLADPIYQGGDLVVALSKYNVDNVGPGTTADLVAATAYTIIYSEFDTFGVSGTSRQSNSISTAASTAGLGLRDGFLTMTKQNTVPAGPVEGDLWVNTNVADNTLRFHGDLTVDSPPEAIQLAGTTGELGWELANDSLIVTLLIPASTSYVNVSSAALTANSPITVYYNDADPIASPPAAPVPAVGDLYVEATDSPPDKVYEFVGAIFVDTTNTVDLGIINSINVGANGNFIGTGVISGGQISANSITGNEISSATKVSAGPTGESNLDGRSLVDQNADGGADVLTSPRRIYVGSNDANDNAAIKFSVEDDGSVLIGDHTGSANRIEIEDTRIRVFDATNTLRITIGDLV